MATNPYAAIARLPGNLFTPAQQNVVDPAYSLRDDGPNYLLNADGTPKMETVPGEFVTDEDTFRGAGLGAYYGKYSKTNLLDDGTFRVRMQQPGGHKYDLMDVIYRKDPATGDMVMQGEPNKFKQQSTRTEVGQTIGKGAAMMGAAVFAPQLAAYIAAGAAGAGAAAGAIGAAGSGAIFGAAGSAAGGGNSKQNLRAGVTGALTGAAMSGAKSAGWLPGGADSNPSFRPSENYGDGMTGAETAAYDAPAQPSFRPSENYGDGMTGAETAAYDAPAQPSFRPSENYGDGMTGTETAVYDAGGIDALRDAPQSDYSNEGRNYPTPESTQGPGGSPVNSSGAPKPWDLPMDDPAWQPDPADYSAPGTDASTVGGDPVEITGRRIPHDPVGEYMRSGASDASTVGGLGGYAGSIYGNPETSSLPGGDSIEITGSRIPPDAPPFVPIPPTGLQPLPPFDGSSLGIRDATDALRPLDPTFTMPGAMPPVRPPGGGVKDGNPLLDYIKANPRQVLSLLGIVGGKLFGGSNGPASPTGGISGLGQAGMTATQAPAFGRQYVAAPEGYRPGFSPQHKYFTGIGSVGMTHPPTPNGTMQIPNTYGTRGT